MTNSTERHHSATTAARRDIRWTLPLVLVALLITGCGVDADPQASAPSEPPAPSVDASSPSSEPSSEPALELSEPAPEPLPIETPEGWELVWNDEFDGDEIDPANWTYDIGGWGWGNGEAQYYTDRPENARIMDGLLVIEARQEKYEDSYFTSARLKTQGLREFKHARVEARTKVPEGAGLWPAFWMLGTGHEHGDDVPQEKRWPYVGEIDIMEYIGRDPNLIFGTVHGPGYSSAGSLSKWFPQDFPIADDWHTYAVEWDENEVRWYFDGQHYGTVGQELVGDREWVFDREFFLLLNLAVGGQLPGPIGLDVEFPKQYLIDHVRVWQRTSETS